MAYAAAATQAMIHSVVLMARSFVFVVTSVGCGSSLPMTDRHLER